MKSIAIISCLLATLLLPIAYAQTSTKSQARFAPQSWFSANKQDFVTIVDSSDRADPEEGRAVQISAFTHMTGQKLTGVNVSGCSSVTHIDPGTTVLCYLGAGHSKMITLSADTNDNPVGAMGTFEIESK